MAEQFTIWVCTARCGGDYEVGTASIHCPSCTAERERITVVPEARMAELEAALREIAARPKVERNPDGVDQAAWSMALIAEDALKGKGLDDG